MASEAQARSRSPLLDPAWPPDDTEESIVGVDLHQRTILDIRMGINEAALLATELGAEVPWYATDQLLLLGCVRPDGSPYRTMPDVFVLPHPIDPLQGSFSLSQDGTPVLIIIPHEGQIMATLARLNAEHATEMARKDAELEELRRQLEELRGRQ